MAVWALTIDTQLRAQRAHGWVCHRQDGVQKTQVTRYVVEYQLFTFVITWLTRNCGSLLLLASLTWEKIKIQNSKCSFYRIRFAFYTIVKPKDRKSNRRKPRTGCVPGAHTWK